MSLLAGFETQWTMKPKTETNSRKSWISVKIWQSSQILWCDKRFLISLTKYVAARWKEEFLNYFSVFITTINWCFRTSSVWKKWRLYILQQYNVDLIKPLKVQKSHLQFCNICPSANNIVYARFERYVFMRVQCWSNCGLGITG